MNSSQSGSGGDRSEDREWLPTSCTLAVSSMSRARRRLRSELSAMRMAASSGRPMLSFFATCDRVFLMSSNEGAGIRMERHLERTGSMILEGELHTKMRRH